MQINKSGLELIKRHEKCRLTAYQDPKGVWTIGWGSTSGVKPGMRISQEMADIRLEKDLAHAEDAVEELVEYELNENEFAALVSFVFNCGSGNFASSTLLKRLNEGDFEAAADEFPKWNKSGGKVLAELVRRRAEERELFLTPVSA